MKLEIIAGVFAVARLDPAEPIPAWAIGDFVSITRTAEELSIVCEQHRVPPGVRSKAGWGCLKVAGPLDFSLVGVLASLADPLARAGIPIFVVSTFDTDHLLLADTDLDHAIDVLEHAGHDVMRG